MGLATEQQEKSARAFNMSSTQHRSPREDGEDSPARSEMSSCAERNKQASNKCHKAEGAGPGLGVNVISRKIKMS